jgi:hypothetical protein
VPTTWKLDDGLNLIRAIQEKTKKYGYHVALGGGVLNNGESKKDLDLYFIPFNNPKFPQSTEGLIDWLESLWGTPRELGQEYFESASSPLRYDPNRAAEPGYLSNWEAYRDVNGRMAMRRVNAPPPVPQPYSYCFKFLRSGGDRIDVFIL